MRSRPGSEDGSISDPSVGIREPHVVAREAEKARVEKVLERSRDGGLGALLLRGDPGIGKTTLWRHGVSFARACGGTVLVTRAAAEEMPLSLVGLVDLFDGAEDVFGPSSDPFRRGRAVLEQVRRLARAGPVVVAIDDLQWLDPASAATLRYALRRLADEPVTLLATLRAGAADPLDLLATIGVDRTDSLSVGPLGPDELRALLDTVVTSISRPVLRRIHAISGGNPLYAIELVRAHVDNQGAFQQLGSVSLPRSVREAVEERIDALPEALLALLRTVAAAGPISVADLSRFLSGQDVADLLERASRAELLVIEDDRVVRFAHPMIGSVVYGGTTSVARRILHASLADWCEDPDQRAQHLALSTDAADEQVAQLLDDAAGRARGRGALELAAELARHSLRVTPPTEVSLRRQRALTEISCRAAAGEMSRALQLADGLVESLPAGPQRAEVLVRRAQLEDDDLARGEAFLVQALAEAGGDDRLRGEVLDQLGWLRGIFRGHLPAGIADARQAVTIAERGDDDEFRMSAVVALAVMSALAGDPDADLMARAVALQDRLGRPAMWAGPRTLAAEQQLWAGDLRGARQQLQAELGQAVREGNERWRLYDLYDLASVECAAGELVVAADLVRQAREAARDSEDPHLQSWVLQRHAQVAAWLGLADEARAAAGSRLERALARGERPGVARMRGLLGVLALSEGDALAAARELAEAAALLDAGGFANPGSIPVLPDAVEALAGAGDLPAARELLERLHLQAGRLRTPWVHAAQRRATGALLVASGEPLDAIPQLAEAADSFDELGYRPDAARAVLLRGRALHRAGRRSRAAESLADARSRFAQMGAALWEARAVAELERVAPGRSAGQLTPTEADVVRLLVAGKRNREIASALYISVATVEAHLTRIYRKFDVRSRSELAAMVADGTLAVDG